jgi:hypothetical protein
MADDDPPVITLRKSTVVRVGIAVSVLAALGAGVGIGLAVGSSSPTVHPGAFGVHRHAPVTTTSILAATTTSAAPLPEVESCGNSPGAVQLRPAFIGFGCAAVNTAVTAIAWTSWTSSTASGTGTFNQDNCVPDCASGAHTTSKAAVSLTNPGQYLGRLVFQNVTVSPISGRAPVDDTGGPGTAWGAG